MSLPISNQVKGTWTKFKEFTKKYSLVIIVSLISIIIIILALTHTKEPKVITISKDNLDLLKEVRTLKDENGLLYARVKVQVLSREEADKRNDSLAKALNVKPKFIRGQDIYVYQHDTTFITTSSTVIVGKDTAYKVEKHDGYVDVVAIAGRDSGSISLSTRDTLTRVEVIKNPLIGRTTRTVNIYNASPYNRITHGASFVVKEKRTWLSVGPHIGYDFIGNRLSAGVSVQIPLIQLKK